MAGYDVTTIEEFAYDFTKILKGEGKGFCKGKGVIPEPSEAAIREFIKGNAEDAAGASGGLSVTELLQDPQKAVDMATRQIGNRENVEKRIAKMCLDQPSVAELKELPYRHINGFSTWLVGQVTNPTLSNPGIGL